jgi:hypothetical protein
LSEQSLCARGFSGGGIARDLTFNQGAIGTADAGCFAGAINLGHTSRLRAIDSDEAILDLTTKHQRQFGIGHETESTSKQVTVFRPGAPAVCQCNALDFLRSFGVRGPRSKATADSTQAEFQLQSLPELGWTTEQPQAEAHDSTPGCLLGEGKDFGAVFNQTLGCGQQQWTTARHHDPLTLYRPAILGQVQ